MTTTEINNDVFINFVLDASGSMGSQVEGTIDGVRQFLADQAALPGEARLSLTLFDTSFEARFVGKKLGKVPPFGTPENAYRPGGMTALLDAVGTTIQGTDAWLAAHPKFKGKVTCVILTDGQENSSRIWHINKPGGDVEHDLGALIKARQESGWSFVFLGAGGSDWLERTFGAYVPKGTILRTNATSKGSRQAYAGVSHAMTRSRVTSAAFAVAQDEVLVQGEDLGIKDSPAARQALVKGMSADSIEGVGEARREFQASQT